MVMKHPIAQKWRFEWPGLPHDLLINLQKVASQLGMGSVAVVGGAVRDELIRKIENNKKQVVPKSKDFDLLVEGSAAKLANALVIKLGPKRVTNIRLHSSYNTVELKIDGLSIDLATARKEKYLSPGFNPIITPASLQEDLARRDFSVNSMAIEISKMELIDPYNGQSAIQEKKLCFLTSKSVEEDPTRVIRAARYSARLHYELDNQSIRQVEETVEKWPWGWKRDDSLKEAPPALSTRLRLELELLLNNEPWEIAIKNLQSWGGLALLDEEIQRDPQWEERVHFAQKLKIQKLTALVVGCKEPSTVAARLQISKGEQSLICEYLKLKNFLLEIQRQKVYPSWKPSQWTSLIESGGWQKDSVALYICKGGILTQPLLYWLEEWQKVKSPVSAKELIAIGWKAGPKLGQELRRLRLLEIDKNQ